MLPWERLAPLAQKIGLILIGRERRQPFGLRPISAADGADGLVVWQAAQEEDRGDLAAQAVRVGQVRQRLAIGRSSQPGQDLLEAQVEQQPALGSRARAQALADR